MSFAKSSRGHHIRKVALLGAPALLGPDGSPVLPVQVYDPAAPPADGRPIFPVASDIAEGGPVTYVYVVTDGSLKGVFGAPVLAVEDLSGTLGGVVVGSVFYDGRIGNGVDTDGFAALPLKPAGVDGANLIVGAPGTLNSATWNNGTKTLSMTGPATNATWTGLLAANTDYHFQFTLTSSTSCDFAISDGVNYLYFIEPFTGTKVFDLLLKTTTGTSLSIISADAAVNAQLQFTKVAANTGGIAGVRLFVNPSTGNDTRTFAQAQDPTTPLATVAAARKLVRHRAGDQILVAEGTTVAEALPQFSGDALGFVGIGAVRLWSGWSAVYPAVIQTYDPADALNEAKYGRGDQRDARPKVTLGATMCAGAPSGQGWNPHYVVLRGFDFDTGVNALDQGGVGGSAAQNDQPTHFLLENNILRYQGFAFDCRPQGNFTSDVLIVRNNSVYGSASAQLKGGNVFYDGWISATIEDNVLYHNGWKIGAARTDDYPIGGPTVYKHTIYQQSTNGNNCITRRNLLADGAADGGQFRSGGTITENFFLDNPIGAAVGGGTSYDVYQPLGVDFEFAYNAILGAVDLGGGSVEANLGDPYRGGGISTQNGKVGSSVHHNLICRNPNPSGPNVLALGNDASFNQPSYCDFNANIIYNWAAPGQVWSDAGTFPAQVFSTRTNNIWDALASGTNTNIGTYSAPNPYTAAQLWIALGYADKNAWITDAINHPEKHLQRAARAKLFEGYGLDQGTVPRTLSLSSPAFVTGVAKTVRILGSLPGTAIALSGAPGSVTINSTARTLTYDGTPGVTAFDITLAESGHNSAVHVVIDNPPATLNPSDKLNATLTLGNLHIVCPGAIGGARATKSVANGQKAYWEATITGYVDAATVGVADALANFSTPYWFNTNSVHYLAWCPNNYRYNGVTAGYPITGSIARFACSVSSDGLTKKVWVGDSTGWLNGDPVAGTGGTDISAMGAPFPAFQGDSGDSATFNFGDSAYAYAVPSGFGNL